jgi:hypothetical protein
MSYQHLQNNTIIILQGSLHIHVYLLTTLHNKLRCTRGYDNSLRVCLGPVSPNNTIFASMYGSFMVKITSIDFRNVVPQSVHGKRMVRSHDEGDC